MPKKLLERTKENFQIQQWVLAIGLLLFLVKMIAYYLTQSVAVLSDALESTVNIIAGSIGLFSLYVVSKPKDEDHPYGHGKAEFLSAAVEGALVTMTGLIIIYEAVNNFIHPHPIKKVDFGIYLIALTGVVNFIVGSLCVLKGKKNNSLALVSSGRHLLSDTYSTVGVVVALVLIYYTKQAWIDGVVSLLLAVIIIFTGYRILRASIAGIMDEQDEQLLSKIVEYLDRNRNDNWIDLHNLRVIKYGGLLHVDCHLTLPWYMNLRQAHQEIDSFSALIRKEFGETLELFIHTDPCLDFSCSICMKNNCAVRLNPLEKRIQWTMQNIRLNKKHRLNVSK